MDPKDILGPPDANLTKEGKVVGGLWISPKLKHDHPDRVAQRERGELCTCFDCDFERHKEK